MWIGLDDVESNVFLGFQWEWVSGLDFDYTKWANGEPSPTKAEACVAIYKSKEQYEQYEWYNDFCSHEYDYVCVRDI